jgi:hypothetical protein
MKTIRRGVFETNSSSEHSATVGEELYALPKAQYDQFKAGKAFFDTTLEKTVSVKRVITEFKEYKRYAEFVNKNQCRVINTDTFLKIANENYYWSTDYLLKKIKKEKITQCHITKELIDLVREFLNKNNYCLYEWFYRSHDGNDDCHYIEKECKVNRNTTIVAFGHAWANSDD